MAILDTIVDNTRSLIRSGYYRPCPVDMHVPSLRNILSKAFSIVAELKPKSPTSQNPYFASSEVQIRLTSMTTFADAFSILTEPTFFYGNVEYLIHAVQFNKPLLMKDFIVDPSQILSAPKGSAVLLIKKILTWDEVDAIVQFAHQHGYETLLEIDNKSDFVEADKTDTDIIGINNRNLETMELTIGLDQTLVHNMKPNVPIVGLSGYQTPLQIEAAKSSGLNGIVIGTALSKMNINQLQCFLDPL